MKHLSEATLALYAGGDLAPLARWKAGRHLAACEQCREEAASFEAVRAIAPELAETPELAWNRLAAEMKANIRLGLSAGECVRTEDLPLRRTPLFTGMRAAAAFASVVALVVTGLMLERPAPNPMPAATAGIVLQSTDNGIQVSEGGQTLRLLHEGMAAKKVAYSTGAQGAMRASYVDPETDYVTVASVYAY